MTSTRNFFVFFILLLLSLSCKEKTNDFQQFKLIKGDEANIHFKNTIQEYDTLNPVIYAYIYNGAGVGIADINNDGLQDVYLAGNQVSGRLYLNKGNLQFEDITENAGLLTNRWCTGVSMVDINVDGFTDIYVCVADRNYTKNGKNLLFINNGDNTFTEQAAGYGLDDAAYSTQATFLDYDLDGDLDLYLLTNGIEDIAPNNTRPIKMAGEGISTDRLYRNNAIECLNAPNDTNYCQTPFSNVSNEAGILIEGYGLGVGVGDINRDGYPDIYCANDFITNDLLWINNGDGTFSDSLKAYTGHTTYNGMGVDIADFNNDNILDVVEMDMLPEDNQHTKSMLMPMNYDNYQMKIQMGYHSQFVRNTLQLNNGNGRFSEIARLSGICRTDWSWAPLFVDMDNDGYRDLFISNGYGRDVTDLDFVVYGMQGNYMFGTKETKTQNHYEKLKEIPGIYLSNYIYKNNGDLTFDDKTAAWGVKTPSYSNGAAFADLDNDGDIDFVINNINDVPFIYENQADKISNKQKNYLRISLKGPKYNPNGWGTKVWIQDDSLQLFHEHYTIRGYKSTVEKTIHFGVGEQQNIKTITIRWPDGREQTLSNIAVNQLIEVEYENADQAQEKEFNISVQKGLFSNLSKTVSPLFSHQENGFIDFKTQPLLHKMNSRIGPGIAVADINNDNKSDFFIGGASGQDGILFVQQENFSFQKVLLDIESTKKEDTGCLFFDANNDGAKDLYVASGGVMFGSEGDLATMYQDRLYINDGKGNFYLDESALPEMNGSASCVVGSDYDRDGDIDLFIGGKMLPKQYPFPGKSYLLANEGGKFQDISEKVEGLQDIGMVSSAIWTDFNNDNWTDLIIVGEWMPVTFFKNEKGKLINITREIGLASHTGWWNSINAGDFDADGDMDYVVGNLGLNSILKANNKEPVEVYAKDFDNSGNIDPVIFSYIKGESYPMPMRDALIDQINGMKGRFKAYRTYANATKEMVFTEKEMKGALHLQATTFATAYIENLGNNQFSLKPLPNPAQVTPVYGMQIADFTNDGFLDILLAGNNSNVETLYGYYDASEGMLFKGDGKGNFLVVTALEHGLKISGNTKGIAAISDSKGNQFLLCAKNNSDLQVAVSPPNSIKKIRLNADDLYAEIAFKGAKREQKMEFYYGSGYLSQNERCMLINENMESVVIYSVGGKSRKVFDASSIQ